MSFGNHGGSQRFEAPADQVLKAVVSVLHENKFKVKDVDYRIRRVAATSGMSLLSFGENISISVQPDGESAAIVTVDSGVKIATNALSGSHRNQKNIDTIFFGVSKKLG